MVPEQYQYLVDDRDAAVSERDKAIAERDKLKLQLEGLQRLLFGQKSERFIEPNPLQPELDLGFEDGEEEKKAEDKTKVPEHARRKKRRSTGNNTVAWSEEIPVEEKIIDVPTEDRICPLTGEELEIIGEDVVEKLARRPESCFIKRYVYLKRANPKNPKSGIVRAESVPSILTGSKFDESFMAWICAEKFGCYQPLYRIAEKLQLEQVKVSRQTLSKLVLTLGEKILPLYEAMKRKTLAMQHLYVDETPLKMQQKGKCKQCYVWMYLAADPNAPPYHVYEFCEDRSQRHPRKFLVPFNGTIHADAWSGYVAMDAEGKLKWSACWAHARRKFENAADGDPSERNFIMARIRDLFLIERYAWTLTPEKRLELRLNFELPWVDELFDRVIEARKRSLPKSNFAGACDYLLAYRKNFERYLIDPHLRMDNNPAERGLRKLVLGRKNWIFVGNPKAGKSMAALLSLVQTCRAMGINPVEYLEDVFRRLLEHNSQKADELLPDQWLAAR